MAELSECIEVTGEESLDVSIQFPPEKGPTKSWRISSREEMEAAHSDWRRLYGPEIADEFREIVDIDLVLSDFGEEEAVG